LPIQLLWINLLTDSVSAVALGLEPAEEEQMQRPGLAADEHVLTSEGFLTLAAFGIYIALASVWVFYQYLDQGEALARTMAFTTLVLCQELAVFAFRSDLRSALSLGVRSNPWLFVAVAGMLGLQGLAIYWPPLGSLLGTVPLDVTQLGLAAALALPVVFVPTMVKALRRRNSNEAANVT
ncbi:MAG: cation-translocating P-type ATPase C-terminal domain-containing protein, partial [Pseudomonadota bacterium]